MRRVCLTLPTHRACTGTITAIAEEATYGAREFGVEVHLLILDSSPRRCSPSTGGRWPHWSHSPG
ncbi:hypothetical protein GA0115253_1053616 [Streptomyces sp. Termitarium-T10T-6]|nr:hypothetical protein GA0115253_1053616 [Streptomyces sp. Termitarium-T10T-6]